MGLIDDLNGNRVAVDTAAFIYFIEAHPDYLRVIRPLFEAADRREVSIVTSALTLLEVLVRPYQVGNMALAGRYEALLTRGRGIHLRRVDRAQLRAAAQLRAVTGVKTPDSLQLTAALAERCGAYVTNDQRLPAVTGLRMLQLGDYI